MLYEGKALLSAVDPVAASDRLIASLPKDERTLYLCISPLLGFGLPRLLDTMHPTSALLCLEAEKPLADFTREHLPLEITRHPRFALLAGSDTSPAEAFTLTLKTWGPRAFRRIVRFNLSAGTALHTPRYQSIEDTLRREITLEWENAATLMKLGRRYALNFLRNLRLLDTTPSIATCPCFPKSYQGGKSRQLSLPTPTRTAMRFEYGVLCEAQNSMSNCHNAAIAHPLYGGSAPDGIEDAPPPMGGLRPPRPPVHGRIQTWSFVPSAKLHVLGAGPSLDRFFTDYDGGGIVCVDTALPALRAHGLRADLAIALEAQHWNLRDFVGCRNTAAALAMDLSALPATFDATDSRVYLFFTPWTPLHIFDRLKSANLLPLGMPPMGNVGITAYALAHRLFPSSEIVPHGLDFAFTIDQYHCRDSPGHIDRLRQLDRFHSPLPAASALRRSTFAAVNEQGEPVRQDPVMRRYKELFLTVQHKEITAGTLYSPPSSNRRKTAAAFRKEIQAELIQIRRILSGKEKASGEDLQILLNNNDFLFAHFPDYACTNTGANSEDISFLKRIRAEIDAFIKAVSAG